MFKSKFVAPVLGALLLAGALTASAGQAQAHGWHHGWHGGWHGGWGFYGGGCRWVSRFNDYGDYVGSVRICRW